MFEYGAILKGSQTPKKKRNSVVAFEYGAILKGSQTISERYNAADKFEYGAILKGSQTVELRAVVEVPFEYGAILKGSQTIGSGGCIIARKSEFFAFLRFVVDIFSILVYIINGS